MSLSLDLPDSNWNLLTLTGAWAREFQITDAPLRPGFQGVESLLGISGHRQNPFLLLKRSNTDDFSGEALGISLLYSGNFLASAEVDQYGLTRVRAGINPETFSWELAPGNSFDTPEAVLAWTGAKTGAMRSRTNSVTAASAAGMSLWARDSFSIRIWERRLKPGISFRNCFC
jgi:alpha-galactosidase